MQKNNKKTTSVSDCEIIKGTVKKQECLIKVAERISQYNIKKSVDVCNKIKDSNIKDICFFQIVQNIDFGNPSMERTGITCESVNNSIWQEYCNRSKIRPHLA